MEEDLQQELHGLRAKQFTGVESQDANQNKSNNKDSNVNPSTVPHRSITKYGLRKMHTTVGK